jgi:tetratricopeptide (TPR) repeat protein
LPTCPQERYQTGQANDEAAAGRADGQRAAADANRAAWDGARELVTAAAAAVEAAAAAKREADDSAEQARAAAAEAAAAWAAAEAAAAEAAAAAEHGAAEPVRGPSDAASAATGEVVPVGVPCAFAAEPAAAAHASLAVVSASAVAAAAASAAGPSGAVEAPPATPPVAAAGPVAAEEPPAEALNASGRALFNVGDLRGAVEAWRCALVEDGEHAGALCNLAHAMRLLGDAPGAERAAAELLALPRGRATAAQRAKARHRWGPGLGWRRAWGRAALILENVLRHPCAGGCRLLPLRPCSPAFALGPFHTVNQARQAGPMPDPTPPSAHC